VDPYEGVVGGHLPPGAGELPQEMGRVAIDADCAGHAVTDPERPPLVGGREAPHGLERPGRGGLLVRECPAALPDLELADVVADLVDGEEREGEVPVEVEGPPLDEADAAVGEDRGIDPHLQERVGLAPIDAEGEENNGNGQGHEQQDDAANSRCRGICHSTPRSGQSIRERCCGHDAR
jgi:hypothetical protein